MERAFCFMIRIFQIIVIFASSMLSVTAQINENPQEDPNAKIFMAYLQSNWDDIHDVIMRFHYEDPKLKGIVIIQMDWHNGTLFSASIDSNNTGTAALGKALIESMKKWNIPGLSENWIIALPIKTEIVGSNDPEFHKMGILTGKVLDINGKPISGARLSLTPPGNLSGEYNPFFTNREGIFIQTLIPSGDWSLVYSKDGYLTSTIENLSFGIGEHVKRSVILKK